MKKKFTRILGVALPLVMILTLAIALLPASAPSTEAAVGQARFSGIPLPKFGSDGRYVLTPATNVGPIAVAPTGNAVFATVERPAEGVIYLVAGTENITGDDMKLTVTYLDGAYTEQSANFTINEDTAPDGWGYAVVDDVVDITDVEAQSTCNVTAEGLVYLLSWTTETFMGYYSDTADDDHGTFGDGDPLPRHAVMKSSDGGDTWSTTGSFAGAVEVEPQPDPSPIVAIAVSPEYASDTTIFVATQKFVYQSVDGGSEFTAMTAGWTPASENITDMDIILDSGGRLSIIVGTTAASNAGDVYVYCPATTGMSWKAQAIGTRNVLTAAFSPNFAEDEGIFAVTENTTDTKILSSFGNTKDGSGWGANIGDGTFLDTDAQDMVATRARMAFPDDFDVDSITSNIVFVGLSAGASETNTAVMTGDVYQVTLQTGIESTTIDLNVRGLVSTIRTTTNIWSIDVSGDADAANIIVGTNFWSTGVAKYYWTSYYSTDSGVTWSTAREKAPTGASRGEVTPTIAGAMTEVAMSPNFASDGVAYAGTKGIETSAFSRSVDGGKSWNQISLIDYSSSTSTGDFYEVTDFDPNVMFGSTPTAYMVTQAGGGRGTVWKTTNGGANWERIWSYANPLVTDVVNKTEIIGSTVFAEDYTNGKFWRSSNDGATFPRLVTAKTGGLVIVSAADENTIWTITAGGAIWSTTKLGRPWVKPEESDVVGDYALGKTSHGDVILVACYSGKVFISTDAGVTYTDTVGVTNLPAGAGYACFDADYDTNHFVYCDAYALGGGIWRIELNEEDPDSTEWKRIDDSTLSLGHETVASPVGFQLVGPTIYYWDYTPVDTVANTGGFWRCVAPTADIDGIYPPVFEKVQTGLTTGMSMGYSGYAVYPNTIFMKDVSAAGTSDYYNQVYAFGDVLGSPVTLVTPDDGATAGVRLNLMLLTQTVVLGWEAVPLATQYWAQVALDEEFSTAEDATPTGPQSRWENLIPGTIYYWRVRVLEPLMSPWSEARSFTVAEYVPEEVVVPFDIISPERGDSDVSIQPTFVWAEFEGAVSYELVVAEDPTFAIIDWSRTSANTFYKAEEALAYDTTYAWKVRAAPDGPWATGVFTTEAAPVEPVEPIVIEPTAPAEIKIVEVPAAAPIPAYLLWTIIGVGAVLFIALIILIVRTRRVT